MASATFEWDESKKNEDATGVLTVRFTYRDERIRIIGAGFWRKGKRIYDEANALQR